MTIKPITDPRLKYPNSEKAMRVTNNQTVPLNYNPRDYGDIVLGSVDRGGNIRR